MPVYSCPKGHQSTESDFCSECGTKIQGAPAGSAPAGATPLAQASMPAPCPDCGAPRSDTSSNFCEICGYNFSTGTHGNVAIQEAPPSPPAAPTPTATPVVPPPAAPAPITKTWKVFIAVDPSLRDPDGPEAPTGFASVSVTLDKPSNLIGRKSEKRAIDPEVSLDQDDGVSHRHALLTCETDGSLTLRDIGSSNGTRLNGADVKALEDITLKDGDQITLGRWTRLTVNAV
jgi:hypothetical protein